MADKSELIDQPTEPVRKKTFWFYLSLYGPLTLVIAGIFMQWNHVPGGSFLAMTGIGWSVIRMSLRFFRARRKAYEWCYYLGNLSLLFILISTAGMIRNIGSALIILPASLFILGIFLAKNPQDDSQTLDSDLE